MNQKWLVSHITYPPSVFLTLKLAGLLTLMGVVLFGVLIYHDNHLSRTYGRPLRHHASRLLKAALPTQALGRRPAKTTDSKPRKGGSQPLQLAACLPEEFSENLLRQTRYRPWANISGHEAELQKLYELFTQFYNATWMKTKEQLPIVPLPGNRNEMSYFLDFAESSKSAPPSCFVLTLGVGNETLIEQGILVKHPQCEFVGVDVVEEDNRELIEALNGGRFVHAAIGATTGNYSQHIFSFDMPHIALVDFLSEFANSDKMIDMLLVDIEGAELDMIANFATDYDRLPTICQINLEVHYPTNFRFPFGQFFANFQKLINHQHFVVLTDIITARHAPNHPNHDHHLFMVNIREPRCVEKYLCRAST